VVNYCFTNEGVALAPFVHKRITVTTEGLSTNGENLNSYLCSWDYKDWIDSGPFWELGQN